MKKLMFAISLAGLLGLGASAAVQSANTFGVLKVESSAPQTIIAVPWVAVGTDQASPVAIANLVMTSNLTARDTTGSAAEGTGDMLYYYNGANYDAWELTKEGPEATPVWTPANSVTANGITSSGNPTATTVQRGKALILVRNAVSAPIYLYGQHTSEAAETTVTAGTAQANVWNLLAPSSAADTVVSSEDAGTTCMTGTPSEGDYILLSNEPAKRYTYKDGKWAFRVTKLNGTVQTTYLTIPAGTGAWYISAGGSPKFTW